MTVFSHNFYKTCFSGFLDPFLYASQKSFVLKIVTKWVRDLTLWSNKLSPGSILGPKYLTSTTNIEKAGLIPYIWRGNFQLTAGAGNARGCLTLLSSHLNIVEYKEFGDRGHVLVCQRSDSQVANYIITNLYGPNQHNQAKVDFFEGIVDQITEMEIKYDCHNVIILGDFNLIFGENEKKERTFSMNEKRIGNVIKALFRDLGVTDIWKEQPEFTWRRPNTDTFSTLDRILYRLEALRPVKAEVDWSLGFSDHAAVKVNFVKVSSEGRPKTTRLPRLDPSLLKDPRIKMRIEAELDSLLSMAPGNWDPHMHLEYAKMCLRTVTERIQAERKKKEATIENEINEALNRAINELYTEANPEDKIVVIERIENLRNRKIEIIEEKGARLAERLATKWYNEGEKSTKYFYRILNRSMPDRLSSLIGDQGEEINGEKAVNEEVVKFYKCLYETKDAIVIEDSFLNNINPIPGDKASDVTGQISIDELREVLKSCNDSSPGPDGISYSYLESFWSIFGPRLVSSWNYSCATGNLPNSHKTSILRLIPKAGKDLKKLTNWRPITLSNCDHKLITKAYSLRLTKALSDSLMERQTAYLKGRVITDNVRALLSCINMANQDLAIDGLITSLDARKAFDSVDHEYIRRCLIKFGVGNFVPIFDTLYKDLNSDIAINGNVIKGYKILRGVKQGDALSCILFIMCIEPLLRNIELNPGILAVESRLLNVVIPKSFAYADDVNLVTINDRATLKNVFCEYERLTKNSGLTLNAEKTEILRIKKDKDEEVEHEVDYLGKRIRLRSQEIVKINGILFQQNEDRMKNENVQEVVRKMQKKLEPWSRRSLSIVGKILLTKTYGISQIIYLLQSFALELDHFKLLNSVLYKFVWNRHFKAAKAPERIKREIINTPINQGGFGMLELSALDRSIKLRILGRLMLSRHPFSLLVMGSIRLSPFFFPGTNQELCKLAIRAVQYLKEDRLAILDNVAHINNVNLLDLIKDTPIKDIVSVNGRNSLYYFDCVRNGVTKIGQLDGMRAEQILRILGHNNFRPWVRASIAIGNRAPNPNLSYTIWMSDRLVNLSTVTTKQIREARASKIPITSFKIGLDLRTADSLTWCYRISKLTSTRHKNTLLKTAHGDLYTKDRKLRFGLADNDSCDRCGQPDSRTHTIALCPKALEIWNTLRELDDKPRLTERSPELIDEVMGIKNPIGGELAINAEILGLLTNSLNNRIAELPTKIALKLVLDRLQRLEKGQTKDRIKTLLDKLAGD